MAKLNFQHHYSSRHGHMMILQKSFSCDDFLLKKQFTLSFLKTVVQHLFEIEIFRDIRNTVCHF